MTVKAEHHRRVRGHGEPILHGYGQVLGPPDDQEPYPETHHRRRLPKASLALLEKTDAVCYETLGVGRGRHSCGFSTGADARAGAGTILTGLHRAGYDAHLTTSHDVEAPAGSGAAAYQCCEYSCRFAWRMNPCGSCVPVRWTSFLAERAGVPREVVVKMESGQEWPWLDHEWRLGKALGV